MTRTRVDCQSSSEDRCEAVCWQRAGEANVFDMALNSTMRMAMGCYVTDHAQQWVAVCFQKNTRFQKS